MEQVNPIRWRGRPGGLLRVAGFLFGVLTACAALCRGQINERSSEYEVKAAFLLNFTRFIEWPRDTFDDTHSAFGLCILGEDPFQRTLDQLVEGETVNGRKVVVHRIRRAPEPKSCQVLFVGKGERDVQGILSGLAPGILTVGEQADFLRDGGMINFVLEGHHVRFDISQRAATNASLSISARLLNVARTVQR